MNLLKDVTCTSFGIDIKILGGTHVYRYIVVRNVKYGLINVFLSRDLIKNSG